MSVDAGTINSSIRIKLDDLNKDIKAAGVAFDNLGNEFEYYANKYSTAGGKQYKAALQAIAKETQNIANVAKAGAITESQATERLIALRKSEIAILQNKAIKEGEVSARTVSAIKNSQAALEKLKEKQEILNRTQESGAGNNIKNYEKMQTYIQGAIGVYMVLKDTISSVSGVLNNLENEYINGAKADAILTQTLRMTGAAAWTTNKQINDLTDSLVEMTGKSDDEIKSMESVLMGFKNIKGVNFKDAAKSIMDMATVMKMDLTSAAQTVGKALDDPINGITSLQRQGFRFSDSQKLVIANLVKTGDIAKAQKIILDELNSTYGDTAKAANDVAKSQNEFRLATEKASESLGKQISDFITPARNKLTEFFRLLNRGAEWNNIVSDYKKGIATLDEQLAVSQNNLEVYSNKLVQLKIKYDNGKIGAKEYAKQEKLLNDEYDKNKTAVIILIDKIGAKQRKEAWAAEEAERLAKKAEADADAQAEAEARRKKAEEAVAEQIKNRQAAEVKYNTDVALAKDKYNRGIITETEKQNELTKAAETYLGTLYDLGYASDKEVGTKGKKSLEEMLTLLEAYAEKARIGANQVEGFKTAIAGTKGMSEEDRSGVLKALEDEIEKSGLLAEQKKDLIDLIKKQGTETKKASKETIDWEKIERGAITSTLSGFESIGTAIADGALGWNDFARLGLNAIASVLEAIGAELAALAAKELLTYGFFNPAGWAASGWGMAESAAAYVSAGAVKGYAGKFEDGGIVSGSSFSGDKLIASVNSGERIYTAEQNAKIDKVFNALEANGGISDTVIPITFKLDGKIVARSTTRYQRTGKV